MYYIKGQENVVADALSRLPLSEGASSTGAAVEAVQPMTDSPCFPSRPLKSQKRNGK